MLALIMIVGYLWCALISHFNSILFVGINIDGKLKNNIEIGRETFSQLFLEFMPLSIYTRPIK